MKNKILLNTLSLFFILALVIASLFFNANSTFASDTYAFSVPEPPTGVHVTRSTTVLGAINPLITWVSGVIGIVCVAYIVYAGIKITTSGENEENRKKAIKTITYAIMGLVIVLLAYSIVAIVGNGIEKI